MNTDSTTRNTTHNIGSDAGISDYKAAVIH